MATITLGTLRDYWKRVYDAITGPPGSAAPTYAMQVGGTDGTNLRALRTDANGRAEVSLYGRSVVVDGEKYVATAGDPERLTAASTPVGRAVLVRAKMENTGWVKVGSATPKFRIYPGEVVEIDCNDAYNVYVDAEVGGEGVEWLGVA